MMLIFLLRWIKTLVLTMLGQLALMLPGELYPYIQRIKELIKQSKKIIKPRPAAIDKLAAYHWPGNVRELQNILKRIMLLGEDEESFDDLLNSKGKREGIGEVQATAAKPSILIELSDLIAENEFDLSSLLLKKFAKKDSEKKRRSKDRLSYNLN